MLVVGIFESFDDGFGRVSMATRLALLCSAARFPSSVCGPVLLSAFPAVSMVAEHHGATRCLGRLLASWFRDGGAPCIAEGGQQPQGGGDRSRNASRSV
jgi:hypothetical protein